jgi:hypothetical protein
MLSKGANMMLEKMNPTTRFVYSMTRIKAYLTFFQEPVVNAIVYLLLVSLLFAGINTIIIAVGLSKGIDEVVEVLAHEVPYFELRNGELVVDGEMPIISEDGPDNVFIVDTSGVLDVSFLDAYENGIFISKYGYAQKADGLIVHSFDFSQMGAFTITKQSIQGWMPLLKWLSVLIVVFGIAFYFAGKLMSAVIVSLLGLIIELAVNHQVGFGSLFKLSIYALTLPMLIKFVLTLGNITIPYFWVFYYGIALVYLWKALQLLQTKSDAMAEEDTAY